MLDTVIGMINLDKVIGCQVMQQKVIEQNGFQIAQYEISSVELKANILF